jgi:RimJ/RimL family protein N-acetyltransferase
MDPIDSLETRRLRPDDGAAFFALRRQSLEHAPLAFWSSPEDDRASTVDASIEMLRNGSVIFGAFDGDALVGVVGLFREPHVKRRHKMGLWGMYVTESHRRRGLGQALANNAIEHCRQTPEVRWLMLGVTRAAPEAKRLYQRLGFVVWGTESEAVEHGGELTDELHMALRL